MEGLENIDEEVADEMGKANDEDRGIIISLLKVIQPKYYTNSKNGYPENV